MLFGSKRQKFYTLRYPLSVQKRNFARLAAFYDEMQSAGFIHDTDWSHYDLGHPVMEIPHLGKQELLDLMDHCYTEFYKRPSKIIRHGFFGDHFARDTYRFMRFVGSARQLKEGII